MCIVLKKQENEPLIIITFDERGPNGCFRAVGCVSYGRYAEDFEHQNSPQFPPPTHNHFTGHCLSLVQSYEVHVLTRAGTSHVLRFALVFPMEAPRTHF